MTSKSARLDRVLVSKGLAPSRQQARELIRQGQVLVNRLPAVKPATQIRPQDHVDLKSPPCPYVSRGGRKLEGALRDLKIAVANRICMDVGASTGGFTDCLLQHSARRVYAVDVGYGQLAWKLRQNPRVIVFERTNIRYLEPERIPEPVDLITIDASFISLKIVVAAVRRFLQPKTEILALVKPQFEVGKGQVGKGGVVRAAALHRKVLSDLTEHFDSLGLRSREPVPSPLLGPKGNREFFILLTQSGTPDDPEI